MKSSLLRLFTRTPLPENKTLLATMLIALMFIIICTVSYVKNYSISEAIYRSFPYMGAVVALLLMALIKRYGKNRPADLPH